MGKARFDKASGKLEISLRVLRIPSRPSSASNGPPDPATGKPRSAPCKAPSPNKHPMTTAADAPDSSGHWAPGDSSQGSSLIQMLPDQSARTADAADCSSSDVPSAAAMAARAEGAGRSACSSSTAGHMLQSVPQNALKGPQSHSHAEPAAGSVMGVSTPGDQDSSTGNAPSTSQSHGPSSNGRGLTDNERKWRALHAATDAEHTGGRMLSGTCIHPLCTHVRHDGFKSGDSSWLTGFLTWHLDTVCTGSYDAFCP